MAEKIMYGGKQYSFQVDADIVQKAYREMPNYLIDYDKEASSKEYCAIYFSSNNIYTPNEEQAFRYRIVEKNSFEWYGLRVRKAYKHIFVRDIFKQWYLKGINADIDTPEKLYSFLKQETEGMKVVCMGSSAGGYAAILYGSLLGAERVIAFNAQFELRSLIASDDEAKNPLVYRVLNTEYEKYLELPDVADMGRTEVFLFQSIKSKWDILQNEYIKDTLPIHKIRFRSSIHGVPFLKVSIPVIYEMESSELIKYKKKINNPVMFTIKMVGIIKTIIGFIQQYKAHIERIRKQ